MNEKYEECAVYVGRFNPLHLGHTNVIETMLEDFGDNHLILIGSCSESPNLHNPFNYTERIQFIRTCFPKANIVGIPDCPNDNDLWYSLLEGYILNHTRMNVVVPDVGWADYKLTPELCKEGKNIRPIFYGGCTEELAYFLKYGLKTKIINRFESEFDMSSSEIKDCLVHGRSIEKLVPSQIIHSLQGKFADRWNSFLTTPKKEV